MDKRYFITVSFRDLCVKFEIPYDTPIHKLDDVTEDVIILVRESIREAVTKALRRNEVTEEANIEVYWREISRGF